ncbi:MAG: DUF4158 domain-containing protein [bacterium]|nr:DUF4158 domain-containing protein [bacterium]
MKHDEFELLRNHTERSRLGFGVLLEFFQVEGRFPSDRREVAAVTLDYVASQVETSRDAFSKFDLAGRSCERDRAQIRSLLGFRPPTVEDSNELTNWLAREVLPAGGRRQRPCSNRRPRGRRRGRRVGREREREPVSWQRVGSRKRRGGS